MNPSIVGPMHVKNGCRGNCPDGHVRHAVAPDSEYCPEGQAVQEEAPPVLLDPAGHSIGHAVVAPGPP